MNAEFRRIARRDKKAFLSDQCKETGKQQNGKDQRSLQKIRDTKGTFHAKIGTQKDRNGMDLTEAEDTKRWQEYTEEVYKKDLHDPDNHDGVITHLESDILGCEVKWALESITCIQGRPKSIPSFSVVQQSQARMASRALRSQRELSPESTGPLDTWVYTILAA